MKRLAFVALAVLLSASRAYADCGACGNNSSSNPTPPPSNPTNTNTTNNNGGSTATSSTSPSQQQMTSAAPAAQANAGNTTVQVNNVNGGEMLFGGLNGAVVKCQTPQIALGGYGQNTNTPGIPGTVNYGATFGLIMPLGHRLQPKCEQLAATQVALAAEALTQRQLDTCLTVAKAGFRFASDSALAARCAVLVPVAPDPAPQPTPAATVPPMVLRVAVTPAPQPRPSERACQNDLTREGDLAQLHALRRELRTHHPSARIVAVHQRLATACNVSSYEIIKALDG